MGDIILTKEKQRALGEAATKAMQAFGAMLLARDRILVLNSLGTTMLSMSLGEEEVSTIMERYEKEYIQKQNDLYNEIGIPEENTEFWEWCRKQEEAEKGLEPKFPGGEK